MSYSPKAGYRLQAAQSLPDAQPTSPWLSS